jgi:hypothetical protein
MIAEEMQINQHQANSSLRAMRSIIARVFHCESLHVSLPSRNPLLFPSARGNLSHVSRSTLTAAIYVFRTAQADMTAWSSIL